MAHHIPHLLVADDDLEWLELFLEHFTAIGYQVTVAPVAERAFDALYQTDFDVFIISDRLRWFDGESAGAMLIQAINFQRSQGASILLLGDQTIVQETMSGTPRIYCLHEPIAIEMMHYLVSEFWVAS